LGHDFKASMIFVMLISWGHLTAQVSHMAQSTTSAIAAPSPSAQLDGTDQLIRGEIEMFRHGATR